MSEFASKYVAKKPDDRGFISYTDEENAVWAELYARQLPIVASHACQAYLDGIATLQLATDRIPQCPEVSEVLRSITGWSVAPVEALISFDEFFTMLKNKIFPAASFIRIREEIDYLEEPDIFHELFGHGPMIAQQVFADFMQAYGEFALAATKQERALLARLFWFTVEFGLVNTAEGTRVYGGGIWSSKEETVYSLESDIPARLPFDPIVALRTPYRHDIKQTTYFVLDSFDDLYDLLQQDMLSLVHQAQALGDLPSTMPPEALEDVRSC